MRERTRERKKWRGEKEGQCATEREKEILKNKAEKDNDTKREGGT